MANFRGETVDSECSFALELNHWTIFQICSLIQPKTIHTHTHNFSFALCVSYRDRCSNTGNLIRTNNKQQWNEWINWFHFFCSKCNVRCEYDVQKVIHRMEWFNYNTHIKLANVPSGVVVRAFNHVLASKSEEIQTQQKDLMIPFEHMYCIYIHTKTLQNQ